MKKKLKNFFIGLFRVVDIVLDALISIFNFIGIIHVENKLSVIFFFCLGSIWLFLMMRSLYKLGGDLCRKDGLFGPEDTTD